MSKRDIKLNSWYWIRHVTKYDKWKVCFITEASDGGLLVNFIDHTLDGAHIDLGEFLLQRLVPPGD